MLFFWVILEYWHRKLYFCQIPQVVYWSNIYLQQEEHNHHLKRTKSFSYLIHLYLGYFLSILHFVFKIPLMSSFHNWQVSEQLFKSFGDTTYLSIFSSISVGKCLIVRQFMFLLLNLIWTIGFKMLAICLVRN